MWCAVSLTRRRSIMISRVVSAYADGEWPRLLWLAMECSIKEGLVGSTYVPVEDALEMRKMVESEGLATNLTSNAIIDDQFDVDKFVPNYPLRLYRCHDDSVFGEAPCVVRHGLKLFPAVKDCGNYTHATGAKEEP